jgi:hypothetical protein
MVLEAGHGHEVVSVDDGLGLMGVLVVELDCGGFKSGAMVAEKGRT